MNYWHKGKLTGCEEVKPIKPDDGDREWKLEYYNGTNGGYHEAHIALTVHLDGAINFSEENGEGFIYLYPEQVAHLRRLLNEAVPAMPDAEKDGKTTDRLESGAVVACGSL